MVLRLSRLKKNKVFMQHVRFDVTPEVIFKPRFVRDKANAEAIGETQGFSFYIESLSASPSLMVMKTYNMTSKTVGEIPDAHKVLLRKDVKKPDVKEIAGMYPINDEITGWIKQELELQ